jgi:hypothetical protein
VGRSWLTVDWSGPDTQNDPLLPVVLFGNDFQPVAAIGSIVNPAAFSRRITRALRIGKGGPGITLLNPPFPEPIQCVVCPNDPAVISIHTSLSFGKVTDHYLKVSKNAPPTIRTVPTSVFHPNVSPKNIAARKTMNTRLNRSMAATADAGPLFKARK